MLNLVSAALRVFLAVEPCDMSKSWVSTSEIWFSNSMRIWRWCGCSMRTCTKETPATRHGLEDEERLEIPESCHAPSPARQNGSGVLFTQLTASHIHRAVVCLGAGCTGHCCHLSRIPHISQWNRRSIFQCPMPAVA